MIVEAYLLRCQADGLAYRRASGDLNCSENPDQAAARIGGIEGFASAGLVMHSTSWRHLSDGSLVLTYVVAPDPEPNRVAVAIASYELAHGQDAIRPCPDSVREAEVVAHAACHLALVAETNAHVREALAIHPELNAALAQLPFVPAGQFAG